MRYEEFLEILLSDDVYNKIKENEQEIFKLIPELEICKDFNQNSEWHIYDVYEHILHVVSGLRNDKCLRISALFHDIGKPLVYKEDEKGIGHFYNHWNVSIDIFKKYENKFNLSIDEISLIKTLIFYHDVNLDKRTIEDKNQMINEMGISNISLLFELKKSDLLAQSSKFHYMLNNIINQENDINSLIRDNKFKDIIDSVMFYTNMEFNNLIHMIENVIEFNTTDENIISNIYDRILSLVFLDAEEIKHIFYKLYAYTVVFNQELSNDYETIFLEHLNEGKKGNDDILLKKVKKL